MPPLETLDASTPLGFLIVAAAMLLVVVIRYLLTAGAFYAVFWWWQPPLARRRRIYRSLPTGGQLRQEITASLYTSAIFAFIGAAMYALWQGGHTAIYTDIETFGLWYLPVSLLLYALLHETYFYWMHRLIHHPLLFKRVHRIHHQSIFPSPFASFSFNVGEAVLEALIVPLLILFIPLHPSMLVIYLTIMTISAVVNHLGHELYPRGAARHLLGQGFIGATHHAQHHRYANCNFGLYFTFWDKLCGTERPDYAKAFDRHTRSS